MKTVTDYQIPAEHIGMSEEESKAITAFESAHAELARGCIGHERKRQLRASLSVAFAEIERLELVSSLTSNERADAKFARSFL